jgi:hypothetical protein
MTMEFTFIQAYFVFCVVVSTLLAKWNLDRMTTIKVRGQVVQVNALPWSLHQVMIVVTWLGIFVIAPIALVEYAFTVIKEKRGGKKNG